MTASPSIAVIVLNRNRQKELKNALRALTHQTLRTFSVVIVSNQPDFARSALPKGTAATIIEAGEPNVAASRNLGIAATTAEIIAFCDDDAVPEPTWLERLIAPFEDDGIGAVGGLVRGRNGVSVQWGFQEVDHSGNDRPVPNQNVVVDQPSETGWVLKTVGTNCAFRRAALEAVGGFDEAYRFFLDEADLNRRLHNAGWRITLDRRAEIHHAYAKSLYRNTERVPNTLFEIAASKAHFCKQHGAPADRDAEFSTFRAAERRRLVRLVELGLLPPSRVGPLMTSLDDGFADGLRRIPRLSAAGRAVHNEEARFLTCAAPERVVLSSHLWNRRKIRNTAAELAGDALVTVLEFRHSSRALTVRFTEAGYWLHVGGVYGRSGRDESLIQIATKRQRIARELQRISLQRFDS